MDTVFSLRFIPFVILLVLNACASRSNVANSQIPQVNPVPYSVSKPRVPADRSYVGAVHEMPESGGVVKEINPNQPLTIRATGSGAAPYSKSLTPSQRKLLALRSAKLDAFRAIAEQIQGMKLAGSSSVANTITINDGFRTEVDAYLRGVRIVSATIEPDGTSRAVAEIILDKDFYKEVKNTLKLGGSVRRVSQEKGAVRGGGSSSGTVSRPYSSNYYVSQ